MPYINESVTAGFDYGGDSFSISFPTEKGYEMDEKKRIMLGLNETKTQLDEPKMGYLGKEETYHYNRKNGYVTITFLNGKFHDCSFDYRGRYTREQWKELAWINSEIEKIEREKNV